MRRISSCLALGFAAFFPLAAPAEAAPVGFGGFGHRPVQASVGRFHRSRGRLDYHCAGFHGRFAHRPSGYHDFRTFRHGGFGYGYGYSSWPLLGATGAAVENVVVNQVGAAPDDPAPSGVQTAFGISAPPVAGPVVYVIAPDRPARRGRAARHQRSVLKVVALRPTGVEPLQPNAPGAGPRVVSVRAPYDR